MSQARGVTRALLLLAGFLLIPNQPLQARDRDTPQLRSIVFEEERDVDGQREEAAETKILGLAAVHHSVARGTIELYDKRGNRFKGLGPRDHQAGFFELPLHKKDFRRLTNDEGKLDFRIVLRNGRSEGVRGPVSLVADVRDFDPKTEIVYLNPVTTLISLYLDRHPGLTLEQATAAVRDHLDIPDHIEIERDITVGTSAFDGEVFLARAAAHPGGLQRFMIHVLDGIGVSRGESFAAPGTDLVAPVVGQLVCINTFAFDLAANPSSGTPFVLVGDQRYNRDAPGKIQVVVLNRGNLALVAHRFYDDNSSGRNSLSSYLSSLAASNLVIVAGGRTGTATQDVPGLSNILTKIGASSLQVPNASGGSQPVHSWSVIGVPGLKYGEAWQKAWWPDSAVTPGWKVTNCPQEVKADGPGNLTGYLTLDTTGTHYTYTPGGSDAYVTFDTNLPGASSLSNTVRLTVNGVTTSYQKSLPSNSVGGFHYVVVDGRLGTVVHNQVYSTNIIQDLTQHVDPDGLFPLLHDVSVTATLPGAYVGILTSIGTTSIIDATASGFAGALHTTWGEIAQELQQRFGATAHIFNNLRAFNPQHIPPETYSMVGIGTADTKLRSVFALESLVPDYGHYDPDAPDVPAARLFGYLERSRNGYLEPVAADPSGQGQVDLLQIAYQPLSNWPHDNSDQYKAANADIATALSLGGGEVRQWYPDHTKRSGWGGRLATLNSLSYAQMPGAQTGAYTQQAFEDLRSDFRQEFLWVPDVYDLIDSLQEPYLDSSAQSLNVLQVAQDVHDSVKPPKGDVSTSEILSGVVTALGYIGKAASFAGGGPEVSTAVSVLSTAFTLASKLTKSSAGAPLDQVVAPVEDLAIQVQQNTQETVLGFDLLRDLLLSDYGKLSTTARKAENDWGVAGWQIASTVTGLSVGYTQSFYGDLMPPAWTAYRLLPGENNKTVTTAAKYRCATWNSFKQDFDYHHPFDNAAETGQFTFVNGFDENGAPQTELWVWSKGFSASNPSNDGPAPPASLTDNLFRSVDDGGIGLSPPIFWRQAFGPPTDVKC